ncbi:hypothetical protein [Nitrosomonas sp. Nm34]|uniref:hypothetical protein n=1 Tax=Nitrosomonas sp. Nm34 TaxID=1881055 RepID=UPI0015877057|nr:hypothetical protein [Nitrosomonas sp. Nm34]
MSALKLDLLRQARGRKGRRPGKMDRSALMIAMSALSDSKANASEVAKKLMITTTILYMYLNGDGWLKEAGQSIIR